MSKNKCTFDSPILIGSEVLFNSKCNLYNYMYNIIPKLFGRENIIFSARDTDSMIYKIKNCSNKKYLEIIKIFFYFFTYLFFTFYLSPLNVTMSLVYKIMEIKNNTQYFSQELGLMENEIKENINEVISLMSKCYSIQTVNDKIERRTKGISKNYSEKNHTHEYFKEVLFNENENNKAEFYRISLKNRKLTTQLQLKDDINNFNDKRHAISNLIFKPHKINL